MTKSRGINRPSRRWHLWELEAMRRFYPDWRSDWIACALNRNVQSVYRMAQTLGLKKSPTFLAGPDAHRLDGMKGIGTRFEKGHVPANKGKRGAPSNGRMASTQFKKGVRPVTYLPVGTVNTDTEGYLKVKLRDPNVWGYMAQLVWASTHPWPLPKGMVLRYRDGDRSNCHPDNLVLHDRRELMAENTVHNLPEPLRDLIRTKATLVRSITYAQRKNDRGLARADVCADGETDERDRPERRDRTIEGLG